MFIDKSIIDNVRHNYEKILLYHQYLKHLFITLDCRLEYGDNGKRLLPLSYKRLFANSSDYALHSDRERPGELWLPPWHGRFYVDADCLEDQANVLSIDDYPATQIEYLAFIWTWIGCNDAYVMDQEQPECWLGIVKPQPVEPVPSIYDVANMIWKFIRVEKDAIEEQDKGWIKGRFYPNHMGSKLNGYWKVKRLPLSKLSNIHGIQQLVVSCLTEEFRALDISPNF
ncbi:MAG: hypothetical protein AAGD25_03500 [Cyanobacteria bacterium P01_F01_bin.150]